MKKTVIALCFLLLFIIAGCSKESIYKPSKLENVDISISDISSTGATVTIKDRNENTYVYGEWYKIEREINGKWCEVRTVIDNYGFNDLGYLIDENSENKEIKFDIDWEWLYGKLPSGNYRLLKQVGSQYISVEFNLE